MLASMGTAIASSFSRAETASQIRQPTCFLVLVTTVEGAVVPSLLPTGCCLLPNDAISYPRQKLVRFGLISNFWAFDSHSLPTPSFCQYSFSMLEVRVPFLLTELFLPHSFRWRADKWPLHVQGNFKWISKGSICVRMKGHPRFLLSNGCDNNCRGKRSKQLCFFSFCSQALDQKMSKSCSCQSKHCALILGHAGRTVANLGIGKLAAAPLNSIKSSSYLLLPIYEWVYYGSEGRAGSQGWQQVGSREFGSPEHCHPQPHCSLSQPQAAASSPAVGCSPLGQPIAPYSPSALTCRTMQLQSNAFLLPTEAWDQVPPVSLTFHLQLWRDCSWMVSGYLRVEFHSSETFRSIGGEELAWHREHTERAVVHRAFCHYCWQCLKKTMFSRTWELPCEALNSICVFSIPWRIKTVSLLSTT